MMRRRLVWASAILALFTALAFSALGLVFVYTVEDSFFNRMLREEAAHQEQAWRRGTEFPGRQGRHYHLRALDLPGAGPAWLVAEVSRELVVRPQLPLIVGVLGGCAALLLVTTVAVGSWLARRATAPLRALVQLVESAAPARLPQGFGAQFPDNEIGALARALDAALARVAGFIEREQHFTRDASHELRTPLAVIDGAAELLAQAPLAPQAAAQLQRIRMSSTQMAQALETLLALAREQLQGGEPAGPPPMLPLLPLAEELVLQFALLLDGKDVQVQVDLTPQDTVRAHRAALSILLGNLIGNAFAHAGSGTVRIFRDGACLVVQDQGPGIGAEVQARLFEPGVKGAASGGLGLGLSIARRLGERAGIGLAIESGSGGTSARLGPFQ